ncbi:MAG: cytochrome c-type biogenesis protein [Pseudohongiellaceae bacterium]
MNSLSVRGRYKDLPSIGTLLFLLCGLFAFQSTHAQVDTFEFDTDEQQQRFRNLSDELRCPMCQNSSLSGSTGGVAEDLRREIHRMIMAGMSDREIVQFMFERYGDFILFRPRLTAGTVLLWFGPLLFLLIGAAVGFGIWRRAGKISDSDVELDKTQQERLEQLLGNKP